MSFSEIISRIATAEKAAGRNIGSTQLLAVSKVQPNERVLNVLSHRENGRCFVKAFMMR